MSTDHHYLLTPQQQELLFAALNANRANALTLSPTSLDGSVAVAKPGDLTTAGFLDNSFLDNDYSFDAGDASLDFSGLGDDSMSALDGLADANDDLKTESSPSTTGNDSPDKRVHPDDDDDESTPKRREGGEKTPKKPGRKPLTSEPTSKRKAQNRAAQRAFRERKEKHLKDLETKVEELEKASDATNHENTLLRSKVEKMTAELNEYKKRLAIASSSSRTPSYGATASQHGFGSHMFNNINDVNFQFEFPKFGQLPGPVTTTASSHASPTAAASTAATTAAAYLSLGKNASAFSSSHASPQESSRGSVAKATPEDLSKLSNAFTPPFTNGAVNAPRPSMDSTATSSPSSSSHSNTAPSSSCGTSPEPFNQSPAMAKPLDTLTTIGEEQPVALPDSNGKEHPQFADIDVNDMNWLSTQSGFRFDPQLFGDYREPQENILANGGFDDSFFNDALEVDFTTPFNTAPSPILQKTSLVAQIDAAKEGEFSSSSLNTTEPASTKLPPVPSTSHGALLTCNTIWERLQTCPKVQNGDFDLDGLCSDLQKKAKCSGSGAVVDETDFKAVMNKYLGRDGQEACTNGLTAPLD